MCCTWWKDLLNALDLCSCAKESIKKALEVGKTRTIWVGQFQAANLKVLLFRMEFAKQPNCFLQRKLVTYAAPTASMAAAYFCRPLTVYKDSSQEITRWSFITKRKQIQTFSRKDRWAVKIFQIETEDTIHHAVPVLLLSFFLFAGQSDQKHPEWNRHVQVPC